MRIHNTNGYIILPEYTSMGINHSECYRTSAVRFATFENETFGQVTYQVYEEYPSSIDFSNIKRKI